MIKPLAFLAVIAALTPLAFSQKPPKPDNGATLLESGDLLNPGEINSSLPARPVLPGSVSAEEKRAVADKKAGDEAEKKNKGPTEITAPQATFDQKANQAVFTGSPEQKVVVKDPEFNVVCDKLTALLRHEEKAGAEGSPPATQTTPRPAATPKPGDPTAKKAGGLQKAIAESVGENRVSISQDKLDTDGKVSHSTGSGRKATYDAVTGDIVLTGRPEIQQGINKVVATAEYTVMTLNRDGHMDAKGPTRTSIVDKGDMDSKKP